MTKEKEGYNLTVKSIGLDGKPWNAATAVFHISTSTFKSIEDASGTAAVRLSKGEYSLDAYKAIETTDAVGSDNYVVMRPQLRLTENTTVVQDARTTEPVKVKVKLAEKDAARAIADVGYTCVSADGSGKFSLSYVFGSRSSMNTAQIGGSLPEDQLTGHVASQWVRQLPDGSFTGSPYFYGQLDMTPGTFQTGFERVLNADDMAVVNQTVNATSDRLVQRAVYLTAPCLGGAWGHVMPDVAPFTTRLILDERSMPSTWRWRHRPTASSSELPWAAKSGRRLGIRCFTLQSYQTGGDTCEHERRTAKGRRCPRTACRVRRNRAARPRKFTVRHVLRVVPSERVGVAHEQPRTERGRRRGRQPVGLSLVSRMASGVWTNMTGTLEAFRGQDLAKAAKRTSLRWALDAGCETAYAANDVTNSSMIAVNTSLGYREAGTLTTLSWRAAEK